MKTDRIAQVFIFMALIIFFGFNTVQAGPGLWPSAKGEICLYNFDNQEHVSLAVIRTVGQHYLVHGMSTDPEGNITVLTGNAEIVGNKILMHITGSGYDQSQDEVHGLLGFVELNAITLKGWFVGIGNHCNSGECGQTYESSQQIGPCP